MRSLQEESVTKDFFKVVLVIQFGVVCFSAALACYAYFIVTALKMVA